MTIQDLIYFFGYGLCHQLPERSLQSGGLYFAVCARDSGIQIGFACALIVAALHFGYLRYRHKPTGADLPPAPALIILGLMIIPMAYDGLSSYLGLRPTTNEIRYATGMLVGIAAGTLIAPLLNAMAADADANLKVFRRPRDFIVQLLGAAALTLLFFLVYPFFGLVSPFIEVACLLTMVAGINLVVFSVTLAKRRIERFRQWLPWIALALAAALVEITLFDVFRYFVIQPLLGSAGIWSAFEFISW